MKFKPQLEQLQSRDCPSFTFSTISTPENFHIANPLQLPADRTLDFINNIDSTHIMGITKDEIHQSIVDAFTAWAQHGNFHVRELGSYETDNTHPIVYIYDSNLDGPLGILGEASLPGRFKDQVITIDNAELWSFTLHPDAIKDGIWFWKVITHEIGHALGLNHEFVISSIMGPTYTGTPNNLTEDDINGVQALYGPGVGTVVGRKEFVGIGTVDPTTMTWYLATPGKEINSFRYGTPGWIPVVGDWNGDGITTIGAFDPFTATWYLKNDNNQGEPSYKPFAYGGPGWTPVVGDWDHNGSTTIGIVDPNMKWYLKNDINQGEPNYTPFIYGQVGWTPVGNTSNSIFGVVDTINGDWYLKDNPTVGPPDITSHYGGGGRLPIVGPWTLDAPIVVDPNDSTWYMGNNIFKYGGYNWFYFIGNWKI